MLVLKYLWNRDNSFFFSFNYLPVVSKASKLKLNYEQDNSIIVGNIVYYVLYQDKRSGRGTSRTFERSKFRISSKNVRTNLFEQILFDNILLARKYIFVFRALEIRSLHTSICKLRPWPKWQVVKTSAC